MNQGDAYRRLAAALEEIELWQKLAPLLPFAVHHDHKAERVAARMPRQRRLANLWPVPAPGPRRLTPPGRRE